ncbi:MAG: hypothetical protein KO318_11025 [Methanobacterium sp.]|jgi:predicted Co/Zn/Cd cation transporter (cation efflux family)|uniref:Uncharacterized protein n=2 Tax=Methanobacterium TaxID=2160 RepID=A0A2H4VB46_9EURY|nr:MULTISPECIES: hypothetical protein [Methanobacterium]MBW4256287.1 hypothetical protein [Methanobacterium sp. YSL]AIS33154.1 hypothetical protein BRM9_2354 [Methanobacterium formicicum]AUB55308.1 hypothetical protein BK007_04270 [Methanobacterium subterraneum]AUB57716.1 hypothetical protein BK008_04915 [Methanobacterium sp. MZ-A1]MCC7560938.1 hypothetical protein [Methanobacterium sp.]
MKQEIGLILKIIAAIVVFFSVFAMTDNISKLMGYLVVSIFLIFILFDTYRMTKYNYKLFYLVYLIILALQGVMLIQLVILVFYETFSSILKGLFTYMMIFGLILIFISNIFTFIIIYNLSDKTQITSFYRFKKRIIKE